MAGLVSWADRARASLAPMFSSWTVVSSRHNADEPTDPRRVDTMTQDTSQDPTLGGTTDVLGPVRSGEPIDRTPVAHSGVPMHPGMSSAELGAVHAEDLGAADAQTTTLPRLRFTGEGFPVRWQRDMPGTAAARGAGGRTDLVRGLNAYPENNPGRPMYDGHGWRRGEWRRQWVEHDLSLPPRVHRFRLIRQHAAVTDQDTPGEPGSVYTVPWSSLARFMPRTFQRPRQRRSPAPIDETVVMDSDASGIDAQVGGWV